MQGQEYRQPLVQGRGKGKFFSEAVILRVHTHFFANFSDYFSKWNGKKTFLFLSFDHYSKSGCAATKEL